MKSSNSLATLGIVAVSLALGATGGYLYRDATCRPAPLVQNDKIPKEEALKNSVNFVTTSQQNQNFVNGYFDITKNNLDQLNSAMNNFGNTKIRVYYGQDYVDDKNPKKNFLMVNGFDTGGNELKNTDLQLILSDIAFERDCPRYCDINQTYLYSK